LGQPAGQQPAKPSEDQPITQPASQPRPISQSATQPRPASQPASQPQPGKQATSQSTQFFPSRNFDSFHIISLT